MKKISLVALTILVASAVFVPGCAFKDKVPDIGGQDEGAEIIEDVAEPADTAMTEDMVGEGLVDGVVDTAADVATEGMVAVQAPADWAPDADLKPHFVHMTYNSAPSTSVVIQWETDKKVIGEYTPKVWLVKASEVPGADVGVFDDNLNIPFDATMVFEGQAEQYCRFFVCDEAILDGLTWYVEVSGLEPDTDYYYRAGTWEDFDPSTGEFTGANLSESYRFRTGPVKGSRGAIQFGFGSDSQNWVDDMEDIMKDIRAGNGKGNAFWLFGGDLTEVGTQEELWGWFDVLAPLLHYYPFMPVVGNHDIMPLIIYGSFILPEEEGLDEDLRRGAWSFNYGNVHIAGFYSLGDYGVERQMPWLEADLAAADADPDIDWKIVIFHHPAYSSSNVHGSTDYIQRLTCPILDRYNVDLALSGHDHDYERTFPLKEGGIRENGDGTVYVTAGGFFSKKSYGNGESDFTAVSFHGDMKNYVIFNVEGGVLMGTTYNGAHEVIDQFMLLKAE